MDEKAEPNAEWKGCESELALFKDMSDSGESDLAFREGLIDGCIEFGEDGGCVLEACFKIDESLTLKGITYSESVDPLDCAVAWKNAKLLLGLRFAAYYANIIDIGSQGKRYAIKQG